MEYGGIKGVILSATGNEVLNLSEIKAAVKFITLWSNALYFNLFPLVCSTKNERTSYLATLCCIAIEEEIDYIVLLDFRNNT